MIVWSHFLGKNRKQGHHAKPMGNEVLEFCLGEREKNGLSRCYQAVLKKSWI